jgi:hypothetical protein
MKELIHRFAPPRLIRHNNFHNPYGAPQTCAHHRLTICSLSQDFTKLTQTFGSALKHASPKPAIRLPQTPLVRPSLGYLSSMSLQLCLSCLTCSLSFMSCFLACAPCVIIWIPTILHKNRRVPWGGPSLRGSTCLFRMTFPFTQSHSLNRAPS